MKHLVDKVKSVLHLGGHENYSDVDKHQHPLQAAAQDMQEGHDIPIDSMATNTQTTFREITTADTDSTMGQSASTADEVAPPSNEKIIDSATTAEELVPLLTSEDMAVSPALPSAKEVGDQQAASNAAEAIRTEDITPPGSDAHLQHTKYGALDVPTDATAPLMQSEAPSTSDNLLFQDLDPLAAGGQADRAGTDMQSRQQSQQQQGQQLPEDKMVDHRMRPLNSDSLTDGHELASLNKASGTTMQSESMPQGQWQSGQAQMGGQQEQGQEPSEASSHRMRPLGDRGASHGQQSQSQLTNPQDSGNPLSL
jgi:hypothetical protein